MIQNPAYGTWMTARIIAHFTPKNTPESQHSPKNIKIVQKITYKSPISE